MSLFLFTRPAAMDVLLLALTTILAVTSGQKCDDAYYNRLGPGYSYAYIGTPPTERFPTVSSLLECAGIALQRQSEFFTYNNASRVCKNYSPKDIMTVVSTNDNNETSFYRYSRWIKTYALSMGAGSKIYESLWAVGSPSTWNVDKCNGIYCPNFSRHPLLDFWEHLPIDEVKLVIYKNQTAVVTLIFDGRNSTMDNWFLHKNLKSSPWNDLSSTPIFFGQGVASSAYRFTISNDGNCGTSSGWLQIIEFELYCAYAQLVRFPAIQYSDASSRVIWYDGFGIADSMAIFISLKP
ncbi:uncharacterized protein LOC118768580 [Octopus sinensis]|uniref:Uncharacterized protein LOC118768580 n=1 Tax=Octopus sinensis TaxID=2607531 RepID=A0A7E6FUI9_9MOLL|nr:uncharacterized protein LOC118768580 [Octopus sinensis]XP_036371249.1 uncharacterized protein LOC118768580 [Octopus sinensis]XP_036371250.1 uncharacterized protein LOC118768580 [Octopus sinensis]